MRRSRLCKWALALLVLGSLWLACEQYTYVTRQPHVYDGNSGALADVSITSDGKDEKDEKQVVSAQNELLTRWKNDGLDGLGLDDIANGTTPALLDSYPRLPTRAPCWHIRNATRCLPSFLLIGTMKAGTTALSTYLQAHEDIYMSAKKEPGFFNSGRVCGRHCKAGGHVHNLRFYFSLFPSLDLADPTALQVAIFEATPNYLFSSYRTPALIRAWLPDANLLVLVRNPVERAYSQYQLGLTLLAEDRIRPSSKQACSRSILAHESFDRLVQRALSLFRDCIVHLERISDSTTGRADKEEQMYYQCKQRPLRDNPCDNVVTPSSLLNPGLYSYHLERFFRKIPREQFHVSIRHAYMQGVALLLVPTDVAPAAIAAYAGSGGVPAASIWFFCACDLMK
eukprot:COSAG02_NODE_1241_length_13704_cov_3.128188_11_plen_397_part_00